MHRVDAVGNSPRVRRELAEGIRSLPRWRKRVRQKNTETRQKIIGGNLKACRERCSGISPKFARSSSKGSGSSLGTCWEIVRKRPKDSPQEYRRLPNWRELGLGLAC
ncbi:hypothetical protein GW17_00040478 [Ensete ventricosum]|nr:hypothetical protein GW17_00040478 [Ensete ventricosum]